VSPGELVVVRVGSDAQGGTQIAIILEDLGGRLRVRKWWATSRTWTQPTKVDPIRVVGRVPVHDVRRAVALRSLTKDILADVRWTSRVA